MAKCCVAEMRRDIAAGTGKKIYTAYIAVIETYLIPFFGQMYLTSITNKHIAEFEVWRKVKDYQGDIGWLHLSQLSRKRTLLTTKDGIVLFKNSTLYSKPIIKIGNLEAASIKKCIPNWCLVEIQKYKGWIQTDHVWGLENKEIIN